MSKLIENNIKIIVVGQNRVGGGSATFTQNISLDFIPDVAEIKTVSFYDNNATPQNIFALTSDLYGDGIMCCAAESFSGGNGMYPNISIPINKPINGKYIFSLIDIQTGAIINTTTNFNFGMTLRFVKYK